MNADIYGSFIILVKYASYFTKMLAGTAHVKSVESELSTLYGLLCL
jgi:hypothetical protein